VRKPIKSYEGLHIPTEHAKRLASTLKADEADRKAKQSKRLFGGLVRARRGCTLCDLH